MARVYRVSFFGQPEISDMACIEEKIKEHVRDMLTIFGHVRFLVCYGDEFGSLAAETVLKLREESEDINCIIYCVMPNITHCYDRDIQPYFNKFNNAIAYMEAIFNTPEESYRIANRCMVEDSDFVICYVDTGIRKGVAYRTMKYAEKLGKRVINIYERKKKK